MIAFDRVTFGYNSTKVVEELSFSIGAGAFVGVVGPNGAGKTTVMRLLVGLCHATSGEVRVGGRSVSAYSRREFARKVGAVTQEEFIDFPFTAREVVLMGRIAHLSPLGFEGEADRACAVQAMQETGVDHLADRPLHTLSGGERKRVFLARALAQAPEILVLDEPAAALDIHHQVAIFDLLAQRNRRGHTVVVVVHDLNLAAAYCHEVLLLDGKSRGGRLGSVDQILTESCVRETFGVDVYVGQNPKNSARFFLPWGQIR